MLNLSTHPFLTLMTGFFVSLLFSMSVKSETHISIAGGSVTGVYYQTANKLCDLLNDSSPNKYNCTERSSLGSVFNVNALRHKLIDFGLVQSDRNWQAWKGEEEWQGDPINNIRSVVALHNEAIHLVVRNDAGIQSLQDIKGKKINIGNLASGQRGNALTILKLSNLDPKSDFDAFGYQQANAIANLLENNIDGFFYTVGVPSNSISKIFRQQALRLIPINSPSINQFVRTTPYYINTSIPANTYDNAHNVTPTLGLKATLMTNQETPDQVVYDLVKAIFTNLDAFKQHHPALSALTPETMIQGLTSPLHPGAEQYYREQSWID